MTVAIAVNAEGFAWDGRGATLGQFRMAKTRAAQKMPKAISNNPAPMNNKPIFRASVPTASCERGP